MSRCAWFAFVCSSLLSAPIAAEQIHRQTFEGRETSLKLGLTNGEIKLLEHELTFAQVHSGKQAERMLLRANGGSYAFVEYAVPKSQLIEELTVGAYLNASRPGTTILARVVLPKEIDESTKLPRTTLVRGDKLDVANRWRRLEVRRPDLLLQQQQQLLQAQLKRPVDIREAYIDVIVFDVYSGVGDLELFVDDLQFGPIVNPGGAEPVAKRADQPLPLAAMRDDEGNPRQAHMPEIRDRKEKNRSQVLGDQLRIGDRPFFMHGIRMTEAPLERIRDTGFNTVFVDWPVSREIADQAAKLNLQIVPMLPMGGDSGQPLLAVGNRDRDLAPEDPVLGFFVGGDLEKRTEPMIGAAADAIRARTHGRPILGDAVEGLREYSRRLDMVGVYRYPLMSTLDLPSYQKFIAERKRVVRPGTYMWSWVQTHPPEDYARLVYGHGLGKEFTGPIGPQPEQIRLLAYTSLAAGCRGLVFSSDRAFSTPLAGRDRNLQMALLGLELKLIETFIAEGGAIVPARTSDPRVAAISIPHKRASLVIAYWKDPQSQYVVGQSSLNELQVIVENAAESAQCLQVGLSEIRTLKRRKDLGGVRITIDKFDTVGLVLLTSDAALASQYQELALQIASQAAAWSKELAEICVSKTEQVVARLGGGTGKPNDVTPGQLSEARKSLEACRTAYDQRNYRVAVMEGDAARRIARAVQHNLWKNAIAGLTSPVADPFAVSFYTLAESKQFRASLEQAKWGKSRLPSGDFESEGNLDQVGWSYFAHSSDSLNGSAMLVGDNPRTGVRCLELKLATRPGESPPIVPENSQVELVSPPIKVEPGQVVRIRGSVRLPAAATGVDGAMVWDSLGGESLAVRFTTAGPWRDFLVYRPVNQSADLRLHLVMTGMGTACFDNINVEVTENATVPLAGQPDRPIIR